MVLKYSQKQIRLLVSLQSVIPKKNTLDRDLAQLLGIKRKLLFVTFMQRLSSPTAYCIHGDLVDQHQNLLNGKPLTLLAKFDIKGKQFENVYYETGKHVLRDASSGEYVNSVTLSVKDLNGGLFDLTDCHSSSNWKSIEEKNLIYTNDDFGKRVAMYPSA